MAPSLEQQTAFDTMLRSVRLGRSDIFGDDLTDRPQQPPDTLADQDSDTPQIGYIGQNYHARRLVAVGYNPGGGDSAVRNSGDLLLMPALESFRERGDETAYLLVIEVTQAVSQGWSIWKRHVHPWLAAISLGPDQIAYLNINPFRTESRSRFEPRVWDICWQLHLDPLLTILKPNIVMALGNDVGRYLSSRMPTGVTVITWTRSQAATPRAIEDRKKAIEELRRTLGTIET